MRLRVAGGDVFSCISRGPFGSGFGIMHINRKDDSYQNTYSL